jgi:hypothetical protein
MKFGANYENSQLQPVAQSGTENLDNQPLTAHGGCHLSASISITPTFKLKVLWTAQITLTPVIKLGGDVIAPSPDSYHGQATNCKCGGDQPKAFVGLNLDLKASVGAEILFVNDAKYSQDFFNYNKVLGTQCWPMPATIGAICKKDGGCSTSTCVGKSVDLAAKECAAWIDLFDATQGTSWTKSCSNTRLDPCSCTSARPDYDFIEVICEGGHVTYLYLEQNGLSGTIPASIVDFTKLEDLRLAKNRLTGKVPTLPSSVMTNPDQDVCILTDCYDQTTGQKMSDSCTEPDCNHFACPLPSWSDKCNFGNWNCLRNCR